MLPGFMGLRGRSGLMLHQDRGLWTHLVSGALFGWNCCGLTRLGLAWLISMLAASGRDQSAGGWSGRVSCWCVLAWLPMVVAPRPPPGGDRARSVLEGGQVTQPTKGRRQKLLMEFEAWLLERGSDMGLEGLAKFRPVDLAEAMVEYGKVLFESRRARGDFAETLNAVQQKFHWLAGQLAGGWRLLRTWEAVEPSAVRPPLPLPLLAAMVGTAAGWGWTRFTAIILIGFFALLRPAEMLGVLWTDLVGPAQHLLGDMMLVRVEAPKTRLRGARHQSVKIVDVDVISFLLQARIRCGGSGPIWPASARLFSTRFRLLITTLTRMPTLITPGCLRAGEPRTTLPCKTMMCFGCCGWEDGHIQRCSLTTSKSFGPRR